LAETGELPAIRGFEYGNYNPLFGYEDDTNKRMIAWVNGASATSGLDGEYWPGNGIATLCNHLPVPKDFENYVLGSTIGYEDTSFYVYDQSDTSTNKVSWLKGWDTANAVVEGTKEYDYYILCLDYMAEKLQELEDNNVPVLFRPLHEAEGSGGLDGSGAWFWWGAGGAEVFKDLWILTYEYLTETKGLDNLIWELNLYPYDTSYEWYPGDEYVDIAGFDKYSCTNWNDNNRSAATSTFYTIVEMLDSKKMVGMFENDAIPSLANLVEEKAYWLYFCPWYTTHLTHYNGDIETPAYKSLKEIYISDYCITLDELPDWKNFDVDKDPITTTTAETTAATTSETTVATTSATPSEPVLLGDVNDDKKAGTLADVIVLGKYLGGKTNLNDIQKLNADCYADTGLTANDLLAIVKLSFGEVAVEDLPLTEPPAE
jgi:mannan endo-1,4-beta-mannosidase